MQNGWRAHWNAPCRSVRRATSCTTRRNGSTGRRSWPTPCVAPRTLRRKLEAEGTSYSELLSSVRHALAVDYLGTTLLSVEDVASALGFSDTASFRHAFKRWTGRTPNAYRAT